VEKFAEVHSRVDATAADISELKTIVGGLTAQVQAYIEHSTRQMDALASRITSSKEPWSQYLTMLGGILVALAAALGYIMSLHSNIGQIQLDTRKEAAVWQQYEIERITEGIVTHGTEMRERVSVLEEAKAHNEIAIAKLYDRHRGDDTRLKNRLNLE
jgi:hypothetical protein